MQFNFKVKATSGAKELERVITMDFDVAGEGSPFVVALHTFESQCKISPYACTFVYRMRSTLQYLATAIPDHLAYPLSNHTRDSFDDLLYTVQQALSKTSDSDSEKIARSRAIRRLLAKIEQPLSDGTFVKTCVSDFVCTLKNSLKISTPLQKISTIPHSDLADLEANAKLITKNQIDGILNGCKSDIDGYLRVCSKQAKFAQYKIDENTKEKLNQIFTDKSKRFLAKKFRKIDVLKASFSLLNEQKTLSFNQLGTGNFYFQIGTGGSKGDVSLQYWHYNCGLHPWFYAQYRLPNFVLTSCFILILVKTGWNLGSVMQLSTQNIKVLKNGSYEIQSVKRKTDDETPRIAISKADTYFKMCISLLLWNHAQLVKYRVISDTETNLWHGWQKDQSVRFYAPYHDNVI